MPRESSTALLVAAALLPSTGEKSDTMVLVPDSAHGTNPASAHLAGFEAVTIKSNGCGIVDLDDFKAKLSDQTAVFMITNPNTVGLFDPQIGEIAGLLHDRGALLYLDGANMNAILGVVRPGDMGVDLMHYNPHKTFSGPHGGGGPGAGRSPSGSIWPLICPRRSSAAGPTDRTSSTTTDPTPSAACGLSSATRACSSGRIATSASQGPEGLKRVAEHAVLNANYLLALIKDLYPVPFGTRCMHEFVASARTLAKERGIRAMDIGKRLIDFNFHAPTVYFPLIVPEALMIEPTETENRETLEAFAQALRQITTEDPEMLHDAPHTTPVSRLDEVKAAKTPVLKWTPK